MIPRADVIFVGVCLIMVLVCVNFGLILGAATWGIALGVGIANLRN